jgi:hypothetical protein
VKRRVATVVALLVCMSCLVGSGWIYRRAGVWERTHNLQPLVLPISLNPGTITTPEIRTDLDHNYDIVIDFQRLSIQSKKDRCLIGGDTDTPGSCEGFPSLIDISWKVFEGDKMISEGQSEKNPGASWSATVERSIGKFEGHAGHRYKLILEIKKDASSLNTANPRLKVQVPRGLWEDYAAGIIIEKAEASILAIIGVLILVGAFLLGRFKSRSGGSKTP